MFTLDLDPKTKIKLPSGNLNWVMRPAPQVYTSKEVTGDLAKEISAAMACSKVANGKAASAKIEADSVPSVEPEDFEAAYQWFLS